MWCSVLFCPMPLSQVHWKGDHGDEVDGVKDDTVEWLDDDDGWPERGAPWNSRKTHVTPAVCAVVTSGTTRQFHCGCWAETGDVGEMLKSLNDAAVHPMSTPDSCVPRVSNHSLLLVAVFLSVGTG